MAIHKWIQITMLLVMIVTAGCHRLEPPQPVNAQVAGLSARSYYLTSSTSPEALLIARCVACDEYGTQKKGDWVTHYYLTQWEILKKEGRWNEPNLVFVYLDSWPTPQSGIRVKRMPFPFHVGHDIVFSVVFKDNINWIMDYQKIDSLERGL